MQDCPVIEKNEKKKKKPLAATWMDLEGIMLTEMSARERQILSDTTICKIKKLQQSHEYNRKEADSQVERANQCHQWGEGSWEGQHKGKGIRSTNYDLENKLQGHIIQHRENSQYIVITING